MTNPQIYVKVLDNVPRIGCAPLAAGSGTVTFYGSGSTKTLYFDGTNPLSTSTVTLGTAYTVTSTAGTYYFRLINDISAARYQIDVVSSGGASSADFEIHSDTDLRVKLVGHDEDGSITLDIHQEGSLSDYAIEKYVGTSDDPNPPTKDLDNTESTLSWTLSGASGSQTWRLELVDTTQAQPQFVPKFEVLGGTIGDIDLNPPPS